MWFCESCQDPKSLSGGVTAESGAGVAGYGAPPRETALQVVLSRGKKPLVGR